MKVNDLILLTIIKQTAKFRACAPIPADTVTGLNTVNCTVAFHFLEGPICSFPLHLVHVKNSFRFKRTFSDWYRDWDSAFRFSSAKLKRSFAFSITT